jgi:ABC-2 type transport system permease protein
VFPFDAGAQMYVGLAGQELNRVLGYEPFSAVTGGLIMLAFIAALLGGAYALFLRRDA